MLFLFLFNKYDIFPVYEIIATIPKMEFHFTYT